MFMMLRFSEESRVFSDNEISKWLHPRQIFCKNPADEEGNPPPSSGLSLEDC